MVGTQLLNIARTAALLVDPATHARLQSAAGVDPEADARVGGSWVILTPLKPGNHTIHFEGAWLRGGPCGGFEQNVVYEIAVGP